MPELQTAAVDGRASFDLLLAVNEGVPTELPPYSSRRRLLDLPSARCRTSSEDYCRQLRPHRRSTSWLSQSKLRRSSWARQPCCDDWFQIRRGRWPHWAEATAAAQPGAARALPSPCRWRNLKCRHPSST